MVALSKFAASLVWPLTFSFSALLAILVAFVFARRGYRHVYFRRLYQARRKLGPILEGILAGSMSTEEGLRRLRALSEARPLTCLESVLTADRNPCPERSAILARLSEELGLV